MDSTFIRTLAKWSTLGILLIFGILFTILTIITTAALIMTEDSLDLLITRRTIFFAVLTVATLSWAFIDIFIRKQWQAFKIGVGASGAAVILLLILFGIATADTLSAFGALLAIAFTVFSAAVSYSAAEQLRTYAQKQEIRLSDREVRQATMPGLSLVAWLF